MNKEGPPLLDKEQAIKAVHLLWDVTFQMNMPGSAHIACQKARALLLGFIEGVPEPKK